MICLYNVSVFQITDPLSYKYLDCPYAYTIVAQKRSSELVLNKKIEITASTGTYLAAGLEVSEALVKNSLLFMN